MRAIAVRLEGPLQSWGGSAAGDDRPTHDFPTRSGVLGLLGAALGIDREDIEGLLALERGLAFATRVDRAGSLLVDYHTAQGVPEVDSGSRQKSSTVVTRRRYLCDASFVALLVEREGSGIDLAELLYALRYPRFALSLGRRACTPSVPFVERDAGVLEAASWRELFDLVPLPEPEYGRDRADRGPRDVWLDEELLGADEHRGTLRKIVLRDRLIGPGPRMFFDRTVLHAWWEPRSAGSFHGGGDPSRSEDSETWNDTTEGWS